ncbi:NAD(P)/FAD-dependent oxidoreductase [Leptothrix discophora]|uniref:FAD-binding oxidoreductase n=1 Tax=Leptothrix discophora TaxID=89 RepID=A0ABT9G2I8_LEPDI|nr:FAD-binding oxidoreductase [Leptothrix discophora]MDP4300700.1 FAD-binding oxidoreductase [Leptothrix discophora]
MGRLLSIDRHLARDSYYAATAVRDHHWPALDGELRCDVAVVGGGLAGLSAALELAERGHQVALLEARQVGWGASGRNGGQAIHGLACDQGVIERQLGLDAARQVWALSLEAVARIRETSRRHAIDCDWRDGYLGVATSARKADALKAWAERMADAYGHRFDWLGPDRLGDFIRSPRFHSGLHDPASGHLHPLKYALGIARAAALAGVRIFEHTPVTRLERGSPATLHSAHGRVVADQVLLAGNVYQQGLAPELEPRIMPVGTYIVCTAPLPQAQLDALLPRGTAVCDSNFVLDYFRPTADRRILYGGRVSYSMVTPPRLAEAMHARMVRTFPALAPVRIAHAWGGFVDITMNRAPDFGRLAPVAGQAGANVYYLQGFSGHGLALTGLAGQMVAQAISGDASRFDLFARLKHRPFPGGALLRMPSLVLAMAWYRLMDLL